MVEALAAGKHHATRCVLLRMLLLLQQLLLSLATHMQVNSLQ
jgi:hypothetical protein